MPMSDGLVAGRFCSTYGIKGWIKVESFTQPKENLMSYRPWWVSGDSGLYKLELEGVSAKGKGIVAKIAGYDNPEDVKCFVGKDISIERSQLPTLGEGEYYWSQLIGLKVYTSEHEYLGRVVSLLETGANDVLVVKGNDHSIDHRERLIPYVQDHVVVKVALDDGELFVDWDSEF